MTNDQRDRAGRTPLHYAVIDGPRDKAFLRSKEPMEVKYQQTSDHIVANTTELLAAGADVNARDDVGFTPLHIAAGGSSAAVIPLLVDAGADIDAQSDDGTTALYQALKNNTRSRLAIIRALLERGADPTIPTATGDTTLAAVREVGRPDEKELFAEFQ